MDIFGLNCKKYFKELIPGKNFKDHFIRHKKLIEDLTGKKYPKFKENGHEFLKDINTLINDGVLDYVGEGTLKKDQPFMDIFRNDKVTVVIKDLGNDVGEWVTTITRGEGLDLNIIFK